VERKEHGHERVVGRSRVFELAELVTQRITPEPKSSRFDVDQSAAARGIIAKENRDCDND
jgi:hypothetical protein